MTTLVHFHFIAQTHRHLLSPFLSCYPATIFRVSNYN